MDTRQSTYVQKAIQLIKHTSNINTQSIFDSKFYTIKNKPYYIHMAIAMWKNNQILFNSHLPVNAILPAAPVDWWPVGGAKGG